MQFVPFALHIPFFAFVVITASVATAEPRDAEFHPERFDWSTILDGDSAGTGGDSYDGGFDVVWDEPLAVSPLCYSQFDESTHALTYCCYSDGLWDVGLGVSVRDNPYDPDDTFSFGSCFTISASF